MSGGKPHQINRPGRNPQQNPRFGHIQNESQLRNQQGFPIQTVMMPGQRQGPYITGHPMAMGPRPMRGRGPAIYSSSPQGPSPMQGYISQQNMQYQVVGQDPYGQPVMRPYIPNVQQAYQMQATTAPFQPQYIQQQPQYFNQGIPQTMYYMANNQQMQQQQQQQQQQPPAQTTNPPIITTNANKPKQKRTSKIVIRDPKNDNKDITDEILSVHNNTANGRQSGTPPLATSTAQTESSTIQAQFAAQVAARVGEKGNEKKAGMADKDKKPQLKTDQTDLVKSEGVKQGNGSVAPDETHSKDLPPQSTESTSKTTSLPNENKTKNITDDTNESSKNTTGDTHLNQSSPTLGEMTEKLKKTIETPKEQKVVLLKNDRGTATKNEESEVKEKANEASDGGVPKDNQNVVEGKIVGKTVESSLVEPMESDKNDNSLDNTQNGVDTTKTLGVEDKVTDVNSDETSKKVEVVSETKDAIVDESASKQEEKTDRQVKPVESTQEVPPQPDEAKQQSQKVIDNKDEQKQEEKLPEPIKQQADKQLQQEQVVKQQKQPGDKQQKGDIKQEDTLKQDTLPQDNEQQPDKQQVPQAKQQQDNKKEESKQQQEEEVNKQQREIDALPPKQDTPKPQEKQALQQPLKTAEPPKKKSSKQRFKDINKRETGGDLMDAYTDKPPPQEPVVEENVKPVEIVPVQSDKPLEEDLSWEDKGEKIGDEIKVEKENDADTDVPAEQTKRKYERDFLLQFQYMPVCTEKPAGLPEIEVVLDGPVQPNKGGGTQRGQSDFLPSFARQKSQGGGGGRRDSRGKAPPRKIINAAPPPPVVLKQSENRWQRPEAKEKELTDEEKKSAELYRNVIAILNKLTPQKFKSLVEQVMALNIDTPERLEGVIDRIFEKAIGEPVFSVAYANMCRCLFTIKVADKEGKDVSFRKLLLNRCQKEFEKEKEDERALLEKNNQLDDGLSEEEKKAKNEEMDEALAKNKRRMLGNIKFIGELFKLKLLTENIMHDCIFKLLRAGDEESLESMCKLLFTIGKDLDSDKAKPRIEQYFDQINKVIIGKKVSSRVVFMLRDVVELRDNKWVPRREENYNPKTIDQIHKEAELEKKEEKRLAAQLPSKDNKQKKGGQGGRDSPKPSSDGWITTGKGGKSVPIDQNKLRSMANRANNDEISLGPSARFGQWGRGSSAGNNNSSQEQDKPQGNRYSALSAGGDMPSSRPYDPRRGASGGSRPSSGSPRGSDKSRIKSDKDRESVLEAVRNLTKPQNEKPQAPTQQPPTSQEKQEVKASKEPKEPGKEPAKEAEPAEELSEEELARKTTALIDEYANIRDVKEAITCFTDLHSPGLHHLFILTAVEHTYEMAPRARHDTGRLFAELLFQRKLSKDQVTQGFNNVLELANDNSIDYPMLWRYLADIITPVVLADQFTLSDFKPMIFEHLLPVGKAAALLAEILLITKELKGENKAVEIWKNLGLSWSEVLPERSSKEDFLSRKNLNFLLVENNDELAKLLGADQFKNDTVFAHIEKNFKEEKRKEAEFINHLVTAVAESCMENREQETGPDCCKDKLKARKDILRKYLDNNITMEVEALFALQEIYVKYKKPAAMLSQFFNTLYDEEVLTEEAFMKWKQDEDPSRQEAKGSALHATASFFEWLQAAAVEGSENS